jgi:hypothetical protein
LRLAPCVHDAVTHYLELLEGKHAASTREILAAATERHDLTSDGRPLCTVLRPHMLDAASYDASCRAAALVNTGLMHVVERLLDDPDYARAAGIPEHLDPVLELDRAHGLPSIMSRLDGIIDGDGVIKFIEFNSEPGHVLDNYAVDRVFSSMPIADELRRRFPFRTIPLADCAFDALLEDNRRNGKSGPPCVALVRTTADITVGKNFNWLARAASEGCRVLVAAPGEFVHRSDKLFVEQHQVDLLILDPETMLLRPPGAKAMLDAVAAGSVRTLYGVSRGIVSSAKIVFELLSDPAHWEGLDAEITGALTRHVPWTRRLHECDTTRDGEVIDLMSWVADNQERLVVKPSGGYGGEGVMPGWTATKEEWTRKLEDALRRPHVVQERVEAPTELFPVWRDGQLHHEPFHYDLNPYIWNGDIVSGYVMRLTKGAIHNVASGDGILAAKWIL